MRKINLEVRKINLEVRKINLEVRKMGTAPVVQWLRICLPVEQRFDPWSGKIPYAGEELSLCTQLLSISEAHAPRARAPQQDTPLQ